MDMGLATGLGGMMGMQGMLLDYTSDNVVTGSQLKLEDRYIQVLDTAGSNFSQRGTVLNTLGSNFRNLKDTVQF